MKIYCKKGSVLIGSRDPDRKKEEKKTEKEEKKTGIVGLRSSNNSCQQKENVAHAININLLCIEIKSWTKHGTYI